MKRRGFLATAIGAAFAACSPKATPAADQPDHEHWIMAWAHPDDPPPAGWVMADGVENHTSKGGSGLNAQRHAKGRIRFIETQRGKP